MYIEKLAIENVLKIKDIYEDFKSKASTIYHIEVELMGFDELVECVYQRLLEGFVLFKNNIAVGLLLYTQAVNDSIELNIVHSTEDDLEVKNFLLEVFVNYLKNTNNKRDISYPMFGPQSDCQNIVKELGFNIVHQCIMKMNLPLELIQGLSVSNVGNLSENALIVNWDEKYLEDCIQIIHDGFKNSNDAEFDKRYTSLEGVRDIVTKILNQTYGAFLPESTSVLLVNGKASGICFVNLTDETQANIPIISVASEQKNKGFGVSLLENSIYSLARQIQHDDVFKNIKEINASTDINNFSAIKMYEKCGFKMDYNYPHAFAKH